MTNKDEMPKPCPFCGHQWNWNKAHDIGNWKATGSCSNLDCFMSTYDVHPSLWNTRADLSNAWQDISSAPGDGTAILATWENKFGAWRGVLHFKDDEWFRGEDGEPLTESNAVTHWQNLPAPPTSQENEG